MGPFAPFGSAHAKLQLISLVSTRFLTFSVILDWVSRSQIGIRDLGLGVGGVDWWLGVWIGGWVLGLGFGVSGLGFGVLGLEFGVLDCDFWCLVVIGCLAWESVMCLDCFF